MISKTTEKAIEDAVSEAASDDKKNPTSRYNTQKGRNNTAKYGRKAKKKLPSTPKIKKDPKAPKGFKSSKIPDTLESGSSMGVGTDPTKFGVGVRVGERNRMGDTVPKFATGGEVREDRKAKKKLPKTPKLPKDPKTPTSMGDKKLFQLPYKRKISKKLGTKELPVGKPVPDSMLPPMLSTRKNGKGTRENFEGSFRSGGEVRVADVRDNPKRGKCY